MKDGGIDSLEFKVQDFLEWLEKKQGVEIVNNDIFMIEDGDLKIELHPAKKFETKWQDYEEFLKTIK